MLKHVVNISKTLIQHGANISKVVSKVTTSFGILVLLTRFKYLQRLLNVSNAFLNFITEF